MFPIFLKEVLKYGAGKLGKIFKSNERELLKMLFLKFDLKAVKGSLIVPVTHRFEGAYEKKNGRKFF